MTQRSGLLKDIIIIQAGREVARHPSTAISFAVSHPAPAAEILMDNLDTARLMSTRHYPTIPIYLCPAMISAKTGREMYGLLSDDLSAIYLAASASPEFLRYLLHRMTYQIYEQSNLLSETDIALIDSYTGDWLDYQNSHARQPAGRRARMYQGWAQAFDEGYRPATGLDGKLQPLDDLFWNLHQGFRAPHFEEIRDSLLMGDE